VRGAIEAGHLRPGTDPWQVTFEIYGMILAAHHERRLLGDPRAAFRAQAAFERLVGAHAPA
ncbi:MAG TPA: TetR/AcrR family transcriptional regulator, partial [Burkholderiales bacterium]